jgi:hypothetical protein
MAKAWFELRDKAQRIGRPLTCPLCGFRFSYRHLQRAARTCPSCKVPLGFTYWYRVLLVSVYLCAAVWVMYAGYRGPDAAAWLLVGAPFAAVAGFAAQAFVLQVFPPSLQAHAEGHTWLKLT